MTRPPIQPAASVILPVYNAEQYIDAAIKSVLDQDFEDFELLLLNDGSTDGSLSRLEYFAARDKRCKVHSWRNRGLIDTLNTGVKLATADILFRMDADDICRPGRFSRQMAYMAEHPDCLALGSKVMLIDAEGCPIGEIEFNTLSHDEIDKAHLTGGGARICHPVAAIRKRSIIAVGGYRHDYAHAEDIDLFLRLAEIGRLNNLPEVLLEYRQHADSIGYRHTRTQQASAWKAVIDAHTRRGLAPPSMEQPDLTDSESSLVETHRKWAWWALLSGNFKTARKHAWRAFALAPFEKETLKLCACVLRGH